MLAFATLPSTQPTLSRFPRNKPVISVVPDPLHPSTRPRTSSPATLMLDQQKLDALINNIRAGKYRLPTYGLPSGITPGANPEAEKLYHMTLAVRDVAGGTPVPQAIVQIPEHQRAILSKEVPTDNLMKASTLIAKYEQRALSQNALFDQLRKLMKLSSPTMAEDMIRLIGEAKPAAGSNASTAIHSDKNVGVRGFDSESDQSTLLHGFSGQRSAQRLMGTHGGEADMTRINLMVGAARNVLESVESFVSKRWKYRGDPRDLRGLSFAQIKAHQAAHASQWTYSAESGKPPSIDALLAASTFGYQGGKERAAGRELSTDRPDPKDPFEEEEKSGKPPFIYGGQDEERLRQGIEAMLGSDLMQQDPKIRGLLEKAYSHPEMGKLLERYTAKNGNTLPMLGANQQQVITNLVNSRKDTVLREDLLAKAVRIVSSDIGSHNKSSSYMLETVRESAAKVGYQKLVELIDTYHDPTFFHSDEQGVALTSADMAYIERQHPREAKLLSSLIGGGSSSPNLSDPQVRERVAQLPYAMGAVLRTIKTAEQAQRMGIPLAQSQFSPFVTEMSTLAYKLENGGVLDPMALHSSVEGTFMRQSPDVSHAFLPGAQIGARSLPQSRLFEGMLSPQELAPFIQSEGAGVGLEGYERRLEDMLRHHAEGRANLSYGQAVPSGVDPLAAHQVKLSDAQVEHYQGELAQVQRLRGTLHDPLFQLQAGHYLNIVHRAATGQGAIDYSRRGKDDLQPYQRFMAPLNNQFRDGARTLGSIEELVDALQGGIGRLQGFGGIEVGEVDRVLAALGHNPLSGDFGLGKLRSLPPGKTYHAASLARQFPGEEKDLLAQFTRAPFQEGQHVAFMGGMPGFTDETKGTRDAELAPGTVGTLHHVPHQDRKTGKITHIPFGLTQNYGMFWEHAMFTREEYGRYKDRLYEGNPWLQQDAEPMAMLRTRDGRQVPVRMSQVSDLAAKGLFSSSQALLDRTRLRANLYASGAIERRRMRRQGMSLKTGGGASASSPARAVLSRSKETRPLPIVSKDQFMPKGFIGGSLGAASPFARDKGKLRPFLPALPKEAQAPPSHLETPPIADQLGGLARYLTGGSPDESIPPPSAEQLAFMLDPDPRVVLKGGPGTGKTSTAVRRQMYSVARREVLPKNTLSVTALRSAAARLHDEYGKYQPLLPSSKEYDFPTPRTFASIARSTVLRSLLDENDKPFFPILEKLGYKGLTGTILTEPSSEELYDKDPDTVMHLQKTGQKAFIKEQVNTYLIARGKKPYSDQQVSNLAKHINEVKKGRMGGYGLYDQIAAGKSTAKEPYALDIQKGLRDLQAGVMSHPAGLALYEQGLRTPGTIDWDDLMSLAVEAYQKFGPDALPDIFKGIQSVLTDEGQDINPLVAKLQEVFLSALSGNNPQMMVAMDPMQALTQGMGGVPDAEIEETWRGIIGSNKPFHQLSQNFRGDANIAALHNAFLASPHLKGIPHAGLQESRSGNLGNPIQFMLGQTQPEVYRQMFRSMLGSTGVSHETMGLNIASGQHPFTGYTTPPHEIAAILPRNDDVSVFEHVARQELMSSFGLGKDQAHTVLKQIMRQGMPSPELSPEDPEWKQSRMQMPLLKFMSSRGQDFLRPHVDANFTGLWQRRNDIKGHLRNLFVGTTRTKAGGQLTIGAAQYPFKGDEARAYVAGKLNLGDPKVMKDLTSKSRKNDFESFQGKPVPRFFRDLMQGSQADIQRWGYNPDTPGRSVEGSLAPPLSSLPPLPPSSLHDPSLPAFLPEEIDPEINPFFSPPPSASSPQEDISSLPTFSNRSLGGYSILQAPRLPYQVRPTVPRGGLMPAVSFDERIAWHKGRPTSSSFSSRPLVNPGQPLAGYSRIQGRNVSPGGLLPLVAHSLSPEMQLRSAIEQQQARIHQMDKGFWENPLNGTTPGDIHREARQLGELKEQFKKLTGKDFPDPVKDLKIQAENVQLSSKTPVVDADGRQHIREIPGVGFVFPEKAIPTMGGAYGSANADAGSAARGPDPFSPRRSGGAVGSYRGGGGGSPSSGTGDDDIYINATGGGGGRRGGGGGGGGGGGVANFGRTMARIGYELQYLGQYMGNIVDQAIQQGSAYRLATVPLPGSSDSGLAGSMNGTGTGGFYNFGVTNTSGGGIVGYQRNTLPMYSLTQIAQGLHAFTGISGYQGASPPLGALTDISALAAMSGMDPTALMGPMAYLNGSSGRGSIQGSYTQLAGQLGSLFGGNLSEGNLSPTLSALSSIVPTLQGLNPTGGSQTSQALSFFQLAQNAGMTPQNFGDVSSMLGGLSQVGSSPNLQQQYTLQRLGYTMTGAPQLAQYQQEETGRQEQLAQYHLMQNINGKGLSLPQLSIQIDQAQIRMDEANLVMSGIQLQQAQVSLQGQQLQYQYGQASYGFNLAQQNALYGPIGGDYSRLAGYSFQQNQLVSQRNFMSPEIGTMFTPQGVSGLRNQEFYAGLQNQQQSLILGRSPLLSDALFQQQMKYIAEQASFYKQELALRNQQREFDMVWQKRLLDQQGAQVAMQAKVVAYQGYIYGLQQQQFKLEKQKIQYDEKQAQIQQDFLGRQASDLANIDSNITQFLQGKGPISGKNLQPDQLVQNLADQLKSGALNPQSLQDTIRTLVSDPTSQGMLFQLVTQLAVQSQTLPQMEQGLNKTSDKQLLDMFNKLKASGAFTFQVQQAGQANAALQYGGTGPVWQNLSGNITTIAQTLPQLAQYLSPTSSFALSLSTIANVIGPLAVGVGALSNILGLLLNKGFPGIGTGGFTPGGPGGLPGNIPGSPDYTNPAAYEKPPPGVPGGGNIPFFGAGLSQDAPTVPTYTVNSLSQLQGLSGSASFFFVKINGKLYMTHDGGKTFVDAATQNPWDSLLNVLGLKHTDTLTPGQLFPSGSGDQGITPGPGPVPGIGPVSPAQQLDIYRKYANNSITPSTKEMNQHLQGMEVRMKQQYDTSTQTQNNTSTANLLAKTVADRNKTQDTLRNQQAQWFLQNQQKQIALQQQHLVAMLKAADGAHKDSSNINTGQKDLPKNFAAALVSTFVPSGNRIAGQLGNQGGTPIGHPGFTTPHVNAEFHQKMNYGIHQGVDFAAAQGTPIGAFNMGRVTGTGFYPWGGEVDVDIGNGLTERYLHLSQIGVQRGQMLLPRQRMGLTGGGTPASGFGYWSSGAHSHVQIDTGTYGSGIDPWPIWAMTGARDISNFYGSPSWASTKGGAGGGMGSSALRQLHDGGVAMRRVISEIGDGNEPEAVVPLSRLSTLLEQQSNRQPAGGSPSLSSSPTRSVTVQKLADKFEVHVHTTQSKLDDQAVDDLGAQLFDILTESLQKLTGK